MIIKTKSGSTYIFSVHENKLCMQKGISEGRVVELSGLTIGEPLTIKYHALDAYCQHESEYETLITTSPIVSILP